MRQGAEGEEAAGVAEEGQPPSFAAFRLPPGKHGIPPEQVVENQRWRLLGAAAEVLTERGYARLRAADICARAGVSRETFYEHFEDLADCLLAAYEMTVDCVVDLVSPCEGGAEGCEGGAITEERLRSALEGVLGFFADEPALARLLGPAALTATPAIASARWRLVGELSSTGMDRHRVEGALAVVSERAADDPTSLPALVDQLTVLIGRGPATDAVR